MCGCVQLTGVRLILTLARDLVGLLISSNLLDGHLSQVPQNKWHRIVIYVARTQNVIGMSISSFSVDHRVARVSTSTHTSQIAPRYTHANECVVITTTMCMRHYTCVRWSYLELFSNKQPEELCYRRALVSDTCRNQRSKQATLRTQSQKRVAAALDRTG